jgi:hypothetical protein
MVAMLSPDSRRMSAMGSIRLTDRARGALHVKFQGMNIDTTLRRAFGAAAMASSMLVAGCMSSPTYGTGTTSSMQLAEDLTSIISPAPKRREAIAYEPRPELIRPAKGTAEAQGAAPLPAPQQSLASAENPDWPESPEQKRKRLRAEIAANSDNPNYDSPLQGTLATAETGKKQTRSDIDSPRAHDAGRRYGDVFNTKAQREAFNKKLAEQRQGSPTTRRYLSEPPLVYREAAATAPTDDVGEDELKKERRRKAEARKKSGTSSWRDLVPGL